MLIQRSQTLLSLVNLAMAQDALKERLAAQRLYWLIDSKKLHEACIVCKDLDMSYVKLALERTANHKRQRFSSQIGKTHYIG